MIGIIYFIVIVIANSLGAVVGMGGGILIKPIFDMIGASSVIATSFYSTLAVFIMSIVSTFFRVQAGLKIDFKKVVFLAMGSTIGGYLGNACFEYIVQYLGNDRALLTQIGVTVITLLITLLYTRSKIRSIHCTSKKAYVYCGISLGFLASFLGIGGGPINVALLMLMFDMVIKDATAYSICIIFCSQFSKLLVLGITGQIYKYSGILLMFISLGSIVGGILGAKLSDILSGNKVHKLFQGMIIITILLNVYNCICLII